MEISTNENQEMLANEQVNGHGSLDGEIHCFTSSYAEYPCCHSPSLNAGAPVAEECSGGSGQDEPTREQVTKDAIVHAIFQSLDCIDKTGGSLDNFADLLTMARVLYCNDECRHCGKKGTIPYYYLGLETKVKLWVSLL